MDEMDVYSEVHASEDQEELLSTSSTLSGKISLSQLSLHRGRFTAAQQGVFDCVQKKLIDFDTGRNECSATCFSDGNIARALDTHGWNLDASIQRLLKICKWRHAFKPDGLRIEDMEKAARSDSCYVSGFDRWGRPLIINRPQTQFEANEVHLQLLVFTFECALNNVIRPETGLELYEMCQDQVVLILDLENVKRMGLGPLKTLALALRDIFNLYPGRVANCFVLDAPMLFRVVWAFVTPLCIDDVQSRVHFFDRPAPGEPWPRPYADVIDLDLAGVLYGGRSIDTYSHTEYWVAAMVSHDDTSTYRHTDPCTFASSASASADPWPADAESESESRDAFPAAPLVERAAQPFSYETRRKLLSTVEDRYYPVPAANVRPRRAATDRF